MQRVIMHIDFNSYFASCEQQENPQWRGKPLGVCEHLGGIIIAPSIEAKRWGIKTAMPVWEAKKLYPKIILTKTHPNIYRMYTARFLKVIADYTHDVEKYSIDEAFVDVTKACNIRKKNNELGIRNEEWELVDPYVEAERIAREIKIRIKKEVGDYLTCSIGIGWNKLVAKIGSDMQKPDGLTVLRPQDKPLLYRKLKLTDIPGIAKRQERNLNNLGIRSLSDLRDYPLQKLVYTFGIMGYHLHRIGQLEGSWKEGFVHSEPVKSVGHVYTIAREHRGHAVAEQVLYKLCEMVGARMRANKFLGNIVHVHISDGEDYFGKGRKLGYLFDDGRDIYFECLEILKTVLGRRGNSVNWPHEVRQIGVTVAGLRPFHHQLSLFSFDEKKRRTVLAMDKINQKYEGVAKSVGRQTSKLGDNHEGVDRGFALARVPAYLARNIIRDSIGFGRMKEFRVAKHAARPK